MSTRLLGRLSSLLLAALLAAQPAAPLRAIELPDMGAPAGAILSPQKEKEIGEAFMREVRRQNVIIEDPEVEEYIQSLGQRLAQHGDDPEQAFTFFVVRLPQINAFAAPGGYIGVNAGLILAAENESELAAVLAHEIAHVTQRHIARRFEAASKMTIPALAALAAAVLIGSQNPQAGAAAVAAAQAGALQFQIDFTRANELEADRVGIQILGKADLDPRAMPAFFERMQRALRYFGRPPEFLSTHPVSESRIADTRARAEQFPPRAQADSEAYRFVRAKLEVMTASSRNEVVRRFRTALQGGGYGSEAATRYGYALALRRAGESAAALEQFRLLAAAYPGNLAVTAETARQEWDEGQRDAALGRFTRALKSYPGSAVLVLGYVDLLLQAGRPGEARSLLTAFSRGREPTPRLLHLLARSQDLDGDPVEALLTLAEYQYLSGNLKAAVEHLERARLRAGQDYYLGSRSEARLAVLRTELEEEKRRERNGFGR